MNNSTVRDKGIRKSISHLAHPATLLALSILLLNDWFLRIYWPSWWTGKIGDFAWLFFFPLLLAALLSALVPDNLPGKDSLVIRTAVLGTGLVFSLVNVCPVLNDLFNNCLQRIGNIPAGITRDPTDLMALISLAAAWKFWDSEIEIPHYTSRVGWAVIPLGLMLTIANMPAQDYGIDSFFYHEEQLIAHRNYVSEDGGLTWEKAEPDPQLDKEELPKQLNGIQFLYIPGEMIKISRDGGKTYPFEYKLDPVSQPLEIKYEMRDGIPVFKQGPLDAGIDPQSKNVLFAMGHEGVLVFSANNDWKWVPVDQYRRLTYEPERELYFLIIGEIVMSLGFGLLIVNTLTLSFYEGWIRKVIVYLGWTALLFTGALNPPALSSNPFSIYLLGQIILLLIMLFGILVFLALGILDLVRVFEHSPKVGYTLLIIGTSGAVIFLIPYLLWGLMILPYYSTAAVLAFLMGGLVLGLVSIYWMDDLNSLSHQIKSDQ
mgnify:CR=1 FL=1